MRAVTCTEGRLEVAEVVDPEPGEGQVLLEVVRTGICGSDLHARHHADDSALVGYSGIMRPPSAGSPAPLCHDVTGYPKHFEPLGRDGRN
jgi:threonine dehydrogenase-like Zn-dependent dehydrogenase